MFIGSSPRLFGKWIAETLAKLRKSNNTPPILFLNSWNEWAEGNHLEPDLKYGHGYLEAVRRAVTTSKVSDGAREIISLGSRGGA